ncbi:helix-turn-helix transcriptional regulator [Caulobacter sp. NIBR2454]|uniref:helix-turn-helix transcriptional regulator n=1 Tax=Caulobacter sp. NIBR2454 TaxID=3015996 RepID=UPI0022B60F20|nr:AraC family transcriptional regulator [Caulobacter sp. NIBR2454]
MDRRPVVAAFDHETGLRRPGDYRRVVFASESTTIIDLSVSYEAAPPRGATSRYQVVLPYLGLFTYSVGRRSTTVDANRTLMVPAGIEYADSHPVRNLGHSAVAIAPEPEVMEELCRLLGSRPADVFTDLSQPASPKLRLAAHRLRNIADHGAGPLEADELAIQVLQEVLDTPKRSGGAPIVQRAKHVIHERGCERLSLQDIARAVGVSPVYLTQEFTRTEGMPLYQYQLHLRLGRALVELPHCADITGLAIDLGFSSHSHFGAAFRRVFGVTPAEFRSGVVRPI